MTNDLRIVVLGSSGVGKSAMVMQVVRGVFVEAYDPTLEDSFIKVFPGGVKAEILDTAGTDQFEGMRDMYIGSGDAFVCVYAVDSKASFIELARLVERIRRLKRKAPVIIVGNKADLPAKMKRVSSEQAVQLARQQKCSFVEASARRNQHVHEAFETVIQQAIGKGDKEYSKQSKKRDKDCIIQ